MSEYLLCSTTELSWSSRGAGEIGPARIGGGAEGQKPEAVTTSMRYGVESSLLVT